MNLILLVFFAIPISIIILSIVLQRLFKCPIIVASIIFAIFLIVPFAIGNLNLLVATIAYTILAFITAVITNLLHKLNRQLDYSQNNQNIFLNNNDENIIYTANNGSCSCNNDDETIVLRANINRDNTINRRRGTFRGCFRRS